ncbi:MAG: hypothetical protein ACRDZ8_12755 [Acidimicrobiales bacterium]
MTVGLAGLRAANLRRVALTWTVVSSFFKAVLLVSLILSTVR